MACLLYLLAPGGVKRRWITWAAEQRGGCWLAATAPAPAPGATIRQQCITRDRAARGLAQTAYRQYSVADARLPVIPVTLHLLRLCVTPSHEARRSMRLALTRALWHAYTASASRGGESVPRARPPT